MKPISQPELLETDETEVSLIVRSSEKSVTGSIISPVALPIE